MPKLRTVALHALSFLVFFAPAYGFLHYYEVRDPEVQLSVDALVDTGSIVQIFVNQDWDHPLTVPVVRGERYRYVFRSLPETIFALRLDPTDASGKIELEGMQIHAGTAVLASWTGAELASWSRQNVKVVETGPQRALLLGLTNDPILSNDEVRISVVPAHLTAVGRLARRAARAILHAGSDRFLLLLLVIALPALSTLARSRDRAWYALAFVPSLAAGYGAALLAFRLSNALGGGALPSVEHAVGQAAFTGLEKNLDYRGFLFAVIAAVLCSAGFALTLRKVRGAKFLGPEAPGTALRSRLAPAALLATLVAFACLTFPAVRQLQAAHGIFPTDYDVQNGNTWAYFRYLGLLPFRDFWYCYGGFYLMQLQFPPDIFVRWAHQMAVLSACALGLFFLMDLRAKHCLALLAFGAWLAEAGFLLAWDRYLLGLGALLLWAAALHRAERWIFLGAGVCTAQVFFIEPNQLAYVAPGVLLMLAAALRERPRPRWRPLFGMIGLGCLVAATLIGVQLVVLWRAGALPEFVRFYGTLPDLAKYSMHPAGVLGWFRGHEPNEHLLIVLTLVLVMVSVWSLLSRSGTTLVAASAPAAVALLAVLAFQKQLTRPHIATQLIGIPALGIAMAVVLPLRGRLSSRARAAAWGVAGLVFAIVLTGPAVARAVVRSDAARLVSFPGSVAASFDSAAWARVREGFTAPSRFVIAGVGGAELAAALKARMSLDRVDDLYVLGDDSYLYILLRQAAPPYITFYNASIMYSQESVVGWLRRHQPEYVLWRADQRAFDRVPNVTRTPLIFEEIVESYAPVDAVGELAILKRRPEGGAADFAFWGERLGRTFDLGYIPSRSDPFAFARAGPGAIRYDVLSVTVEKPVQGRVREVRFDLGSSGEFSVRFLERKGTSRYNVVLDRVWFWHAARAAGSDPMLLGPGDGASARISPVELDRPILY